MSHRIAYRWIIAVVLFVAYSIQYLDRVKGMSRPMLKFAWQASLVEHFTQPLRFVQVLAC